MCGGDMSKVIYVFLCLYLSLLEAASYKAEVNVTPIYLSNNQQEYKIELQVIKNEKNQDLLLASTNLRCKINSPITLTLQNVDKDKVISINYLLEDASEYLLSTVHLFNQNQELFSESKEIKKGL